MRMRLTGVLLFGLAAGLAGCGPDAPVAREKAEVTGALTAGGKPLGDVVIAFRATGGSAQPIQFKTKPDGSFGGTMATGKYAWYLPTEGMEAEGVLAKADAAKHLAAVKGVPAKYRNADLERQIDVSSGAKLDLKAD